MGATAVPDVVKRLLKEKDEWRERYSDAGSSLDEAFDRMRELDSYRERYEQLREALIDALGPQADTLISLAVR